MEEENELMEVNSDSDDSSCDDAEIEVLNSRAEELERQISDNKYLYDAHVELVALYRKLGDLTSMRLAYQRFHEYFPLTPQIWLDWINVEKSLASSENEIKTVFNLFDKAVEDYISVELWVEYVQYSIGASNLQTTRSIVERGLTAAGLHAAEGSLLWDTLRELEFAHLSLAEENSDPWNEQLGKIVEVFRRQLSVPLIGMESTYAEWKAWVEKLPENHQINLEPVEWGYKKALKILETYKPFEDKLLVTTEEAEVVRTYKDYIKMLADPSTILVVYERAVAQLCLNTNIWMDYCSYAMKLGEAADKVSKRALRNCPWCEELWVVRLRVLEHLDRGEAEVLKTFEEGMAVVAGTQGVELWLTYLEYFNRKVQDKDKLQKLFDQAMTQLNEMDVGAKIARWNARILAKEGKMLDARRLWKNILKNPQMKSTANIWLEFANLERQYGDVHQVRSVFQRALSNCRDWPQLIADEWMMFEREFGKLEDVLKCVDKCTELIVKAPPPPQEVVVEKTSDKPPKRKMQFGENPKETKKPKHETPAFKKKVPILKDPTKTVFISNLYPSITEKKLWKLFPNAVNIELVVDRQGKSRCYGYVQFNLEEEVMHALARDRELLEGRPIFISNCKPDRTERKSAFKYSSEVEANKLFVRGLPIEKTQADLEEIFKPFGSISVRLVVHKSGQSKGLAYVEFPDDEMAKKAMEKTDQMKIGEHTISVAISAPPSKSSPKAASATPHHPKSRLQVPLIPRAIQVKGDKSKNGNEESARPQSKSNSDFRKMFNI